MPDSAPPQFNMSEAWDVEFKPYAEAIGYLVRDWNSLQEHFRGILAALMPSEPGIAQAIWYAIQNDRLQRAILLTAARAKLRGGKHEARLADIEWAIKRADDLGSQRDDAVHSPVSLLLNGPLQFVPRNTGHPRAKTLVGRDLLAEIKRYGATAEKLNMYVAGLELHLNLLLRDFPEENVPPLPDRPRLSIAQSKNTD